MSKDLHRELKNALAEIERLRKENEKLRQQIAGAAHTSNNAFMDKSPAVSSIDHSATDEEKIRVFRSYFRGRDDVYALRWTNRFGKSGYSPACYPKRNSFARGKSNGKRKERHLVPLDDGIIREHLAGKKAIGIFSLLKDDTCWLLAVDFDKSTWRKDAQVFASTCRELSLPFALERSRSGDGCHVWFFFKEPVLASTARRFASRILTLALEKRHQIGLDSYDRLFPNQDTLPKGGFGNLIALPLQGKSRQEGNTVFLNDDFKPHDEQWAFLSGITKLSLAEVKKTIRFIKKDRSSTTSDSTESVKPWTLPPSGVRTEQLEGIVLPKKVRLISGNLIYIEKKNLPSTFINRIIRLAAFQNPEFYRAQALRLSTYDKPRIISCSEEFDDYIGLPRGCLDSVVTLCDEYGIRVNTIDERYRGIAIKARFQGELRKEQLEVGKKMLEHDIGVLSLPTAFGKTVLASWLIAKRKFNTLILVHRRQLLEQWLVQLSIFLDTPADDIGQIGAGKNKPTKRIDVGIIQSLIRKGKVNDIVAEDGHVVVDECHHVPAFSFESILKQVKAKYVLGLTATPTRKDSHHPIIMMQCGPVRHHIKKLTESLSQFKRQVIIRKTSFQLRIDDQTSIQTIYRALMKDEQRNDLIFNDVLLSLENKRSPLLLTERTSHLEYLAKRLKGFAKNVVLKGGLSSKKLKSAMEKIAAIPDNEERIILATGRYIGEGFDDRRLDTLFLVMPISWRGTLKQYVGRLHRTHANKSLVQVFDYADERVPILAKMLQRRLRGYKSLGYQTMEVDIQNVYDA